MKILLNFAFLFFSINALAGTMKFKTGELLWKSSHSKTEISSQNFSENETAIYYKPSCIFICYTGCTTEIPPIEGKETLLTPWGDPTSILFQKLPEPFSAYRILVAQLYGGAINGESSFKVQTNIQNDFEVINFHETSASLDKMQIGGKVISDVDLLIGPDVFLRAECSYARTR